MSFDEQSDKRGLAARILGALPSVSGLDVKHQKLKN